MLRVLSVSFCRKYSLTVARWPPTSPATRPSSTLRNYTTRRDVTNGTSATNGAPAITHAQLGSALRECTESARALGAAHRWRPNTYSASAANWRAADQDPVARTLCEADVQAITLLHSGYEHAAATGQSISAGRPFLPHSLARTATEHLLRAQHLLDMEAAPGERIRRRMNEWLYAIVESSYRREGLLNGARNQRRSGPARAWTGQGDAVERRRRARVCSG